MGIPLELLKPHQDETFAQLVHELRELRRDPSTNHEAITQVTEMMNELVTQLAADVIKRDYLEPNPDNVPLDILPLDTDDVFHGQEVERAKLLLKDKRRYERRIT